MPQIATRASLRAPVGAGRARDCCRSWPDRIGRHTSAVSPCANLAKAVGPFRQRAEEAAILLDIDGTLAPIVPRPEEAVVPEGTRALLIELSGRYRLVGFVSGRPANQARQIVAIGSLPYVGNHGAELLAPGAVAPTPLAQIGDDGQVAQGLVEPLRPELYRLRVEVEEKGPILALHWRRTVAEKEAISLLEEIAQRAQAAGLRTHWGRKVLELRPAWVPDKGVGVRALLSLPNPPPALALYVGDEQTDLDAFAALSDLAAEGRLERALRIAVSSPEAPPQLLEEADLVIDGQEAVPQLLAALL